MNTAPLEYHQSLPENLEMWRATVVTAPYEPGFTPADSVLVEFCISYTVNGQTYWDNNGGNNYRLKTNEHI